MKKKHIITAAVAAAAATAAAAALIPFKAEKDEETGILTLRALLWSATIDPKTDEKPANVDIRFGLPCRKAEEEDFADDFEDIDEESEAPADQEVKDEAAAAQEASEEKPAEEPAPKEKAAEEDKEPAPAAVAEDSDAAEEAEDEEKAEEAENEEEMFDNSVVLPGSPENPPENA